MKFLFNYVSSTEQAIFLYNKGNTDTACPVKDMVDYFNDYGEILNNTLSKWNKNEKFETGNTDLKQLVSRNKELLNVLIFNKIYSFY